MDKTEFFTKEQYKETIQYMAYLSAKNADSKGLEMAIRQGWNPQTFDVDAGSADNDRMNIGVRVISSEASAQEKLECIKLLCNGNGGKYPKMSVDDFRDKDGNTLFAVASTYNPQVYSEKGEYENKKLMKGLLEMGADKNAQNKDGLTPLYLNTVINSERNVQTLLEMGCDTEIKTKYGATAFQEAENRGYTDIAGSLKCARILGLKDRTSTR